MFLVVLAASALLVSLREALLVLPLPSSLVSLLPFSEPVFFVQGPSLVV
jgi:hypothetical protein